jgi:AcrR family transcriptional regulator
MVEAPDRAASEAAKARRAAIVAAAAGVFLRYGFKKTSMDDLARAAGLSRQGLYLHFPTKEAIFKEALLQLIADARTASRAALADDDQSIEDRLIGAFAALHCNELGRSGAEHMSELLATSAELVGPVVDELEQGLVADVARALRSAGITARWKPAGLSAKDLAEHLHATSYGLKHRVGGPSEYHEHMRVAVRIVCRGAVV